MEAADHFKRLWKTDKVCIPADVDSEGNLVLATMLRTKGNGADRVNIGTLAKERAKLPPAEQPRFPLTPVIQAWIKYLRRLEPDRRVTGIIPITTRIQGVGQLSFNMSSISETLALGEIARETITTYLPGLDPVDDAMVVPPLLLLYDHTNLPPSPEDTERPSP